VNFESFSASGGGLRPQIPNPRLSTGAPPLDPLGTLSPRPPALPPRFLHPRYGPDVLTSRRRRVTSASSSTASWRCLRRWPPCVAVATTSYSSSDRSSDRCHLTPSKRWSRRLSRVAWTTVTRITQNAKDGVFKKKAMQIALTIAAMRIVSCAVNVSGLSVSFIENRASILFMSWLPV